MMRTPTEVWLEGLGWTRRVDSHALATITPHESHEYLFELPPGAKLLRVRVTDDLGRRTTSSTFMGSVRRNLFRLRWHARRYIQP